MTGKRPAAFATSFTSSFFETLGQETAKWVWRGLAFLVLEANGFVDVLVRILERAF